MRSHWIALCLAVGLPPENARSHPQNRAAPQELVELEGVYETGARPRPSAAVIASQHDAQLSSWNAGGSSQPDSVTARSGFHPAVRVLVESRALRDLGKRGLTDRAILAQTRNQGYWPFRLCYEATLRDHASAAGQSVLRFSIDRRGRVSYARRLSSRLPSEGVSCLRKALYGLRFTPSPQRRVDVDVSIKLSPGDVPVLPLPKTASAPREAGGVQETLPAVRGCYRLGLRKDARLWGRLALAVRIDEQGRIRELTETESRFPDPAVTECVRQVLIGTPIGPAPPGGWTLAYRLGTLPDPAPAET